jgi:hypothetical protein
LYRLYFTPPVHNNESPSIDDVRPDNAKINKDKYAQK